MYICFKIVAGAGEIGPEKGLREGGVTCARYALPGWTREAQEQTRFSSVLPQTCMCLLQESSPNLPKAAHLCKAEAGISYGLAYISHHCTCSTPACLHGVTSTAQSQWLEPRHIPPRQMTTIEKKIAVSFSTDFVWCKSRRRVLPPAGSLLPRAELCHRASLYTQPFADGGPSGSLSR